MIVRVFGGQLNTSENIVMAARTEEPEQAPTTPAAAEARPEGLEQAPTTPRRFSLKDLRNMSAARAAAARQATEYQESGLFYSPARQRLSGMGEFRRSEYSARPLRWLDVGTLYAQATPRSFIHSDYRHAGRHLPPLRPSTSVRIAHQAPRRQPLLEEDGSSASCAICLANFLQVDLPSLEKRFATVQWTQCCGHPFHEACIAPLLRCPMCRTGLGFGLVRECSKLSPPVPITSALHLLSSSPLEATGAKAALAAQPGG